MESQRSLPGFVQFIHQPRQRTIHPNELTTEQREEDPIEDATDKKDPSDERMSPSSQGEVVRTPDPVGGDKWETTKVPENCNDAEALSPTSTWTVPKTHNDGVSNESQDEKEQKEERMSTTSREDNTMMTLEPLPCDKYCKEGEAGEKASVSYDDAAVSRTLPEGHDDSENDNKDRQEEKEFRVSQPPDAGEKDGPGCTKIAGRRFRASNCHRVQRRHRQPDQLSLEDSFAKSERSLPFLRNELIVVDSDSD